MKKIFTLLLLIGFSAVGTAQKHPLIDSLIKETNLDSVVQHVRNLSGEDECTVGGKKVKITNRQAANNDVAADYIKETLERYGLKVTNDNYGSGRNVIAEQIGTTYPDKKIIICGHYDAVANYCADDNASSISAIIETARHLSQFKFKYTILYVAWDEEETGLKGSKSYASKVDKQSVYGVVNVEMLGYDSNKDWLFEIHTKQLGNSVELANTVVNVNSTYGLKLKSKVENPGTDRSDHASFWNNGMGAITYSEAFFSNDGNPDYHSARDRIDKFNLPYYHELCKLTVGNLATLAEPDDIINGVSSIDNLESGLAISSHPNPSKDNAEIAYILPEKTKVALKIYDETGKIVYEILEESKIAGKHFVEVNTSKFQMGIYHIVLQTEKNLKTHKLVVLK